MQKQILFIIAIGNFLFSCTENSLQPGSYATLKTEVAKTTVTPTTVTQPTTPATAATILQRKQIPVLCYHRIENNRPPDDYNVTVPVFKEELKLLADSGYHTILPDQLYDYLTKGTPLPSKPFMITYDDTREEQYSIAAPEMEKYGFKGVFFVMTIPIGRPHYMTSEQIKELSDKGHVIASHTWDHHNVKQLKEEDWPAQIEKPNARIQAITGKPVEYFAYPFGLWNDTAAVHIKKYGFKAAFQLTSKRSETDPLYTVRRTLVPGTWTPGQMLKRMKTMF